MNEKLRKLRDEYHVAREIAKTLLDDTESTAEQRDKALKAAEEAKAALDAALEEERRMADLADPPSIEDRADQEATERREAEARREAEGRIQFAPPGAPPPTEEEERNAASLTNSYKPFGWVYGLPAYSQERSVLERAGADLREQAELERLALERYVRVPNMQAYFNAMDAEQLKVHELISVKQMPTAMMEALGLEAITEVVGGVVYTPVGFVATPIHDPGAPATALRPFLDVQPVSTDTGFRVGLGNVEMSYVAESGASGAQDPRQIRVNYDVNTVRNHTDITTEHLQDQGYDAVGQLSRLYTEAYNRSVNRYVVAGTGSGQPQGLLTYFPTARTSQIQRTATLGSLTRADIRAAFYKLDAQWRVNAAWNGPSGLYEGIAAFEDTDDKGSIRQDPTGRVLGRPTIQWDGTGWSARGAANNFFGCIGDFAQYMLFERMGLAMMRDDYARADNWEVRFRFAARNDGKVVPLDVPTANSNAGDGKGPFILLQEKAS